MSATEFKVGDKVRLADVTAATHTGLVLGRVYEVTTVDNGDATSGCSDIYINGEGWFQSRRFVLVTETPSKYETLGAEIGKLVSIKQACYGDSHGKAGAVIRILYPDGIKPEQYDDALTLVRILDKLFRIATDKDALGESPYKDIAGYGLLGAAKAVAK